jgi:hypothetical protein
LPRPALAAGLFYLRRISMGDSTGRRQRISAAGSPNAAEEPMLWTIFAILLILWLLGFAMDVAGGLIHVLLVIAAVVLIINLLSGRRTVV